MDSGDLCTSCGFCCDGLVFSGVQVLEDETGALERKGLEVLPNSKGQGFRQRCAMFQDGLCAIYVERPKACQVYRCKLLAAVEGGRVDVSRARSIVARVKDLVARIETVVGRAERGDRLIQRVRRFGSEARPGKETDELMLRFASLQILLRKYFDARAVLPFETLSTPVPDERVDPPTETSR